MNVAKGSFVFFNLFIIYIISQLTNYLDIHIFISAHISNILLACTVQ